jgi:hypothetical protein
MPINGIISDIAADGITITGTPSGGTRPNIGQLLANNPTDGIQLISRTVNTQSSISVGGNIPLPVAFGKNKYIISFDGKSYCPGIDYIPGTTEARWINPNISIPLHTNITIWGPANDYTADLITIEPINMHSGVFSGSNISLLGEGGGLSLPATIESIFLVVNGFTFSSFTFSDPVLSWTGSPALTTTDIVFAYYFNKRTSVPYRLSEFQNRLAFAATAGISSYNIGAIPKINMIGAAQLFVNNTRKVVGVDYSLEYPFIRWRGTPFAGGEILDLSYIRDSQSSILINNSTPTGGGVVIAGDGRFEVPVSHTPIVAELSILTINGNLMINSSYSHITGTGFVPEYSQVGGVVRVDPTARGLPYRTLSLSDEYVVSVFNDAASSNFLKLEYFKGYSGVGDVKTLQAIPASASKVIVWVSGRAFFTLNGEINVVGNQFNINAPYLLNDPDMDIVVMYFTGAAYANLWKLENVVVPGLSWTIGSNIGSFSGSPIANIDNTFLFVNGQREMPGKYNKTGDGSALVNVSLAGTVHGSTSVDPDQVVLLRV